MKKRFIFSLVLGIILINLVLTSANLNIFVRPLEVNVYITYTFNISSDDDCTNVLISHTEVLYTDITGISFVSINISSLNNTVPNRLCAYKDGSLIGNFSWSDIILNSLRVNSLIANNANISNLTISGILKASSWENVSGSQISNDLNWINSSSLNESTLNVNSSIYANNWTTENGTINSINTTQLRNNNGILNILESWLNGLYCQLTGCNISGDLSISGNLTSDWANFNNLNVSGVIYGNGSKLTGISATDTWSLNYSSYLNTSLIFNNFLTINGSNANQNIDISLFNLTSDWANFNNINVTGTSYLGDIIINAENITADYFTGKLYGAWNGSVDYLTKIQIDSYNYNSTYNVTYHNKVDTWSLNYTNYPTKSDLYSNLTTTLLANGSRIWTGNQNVGSFNLTNVDWGFFNSLNISGQIIGPNSNFAQYQFLNNNFNGSGNFTTSGDLSFNGFSSSDGNLTWDNVNKRLGIGGAPTKTLSFFSADGSDEVTFEHDNSNFYARTTDGSYIWTTKEVNGNGLFRMQGSGTGFGGIGVYGPNNANILTMEARTNEGYLYTNNCDVLSLERSAEADITCFQWASEGETKEVKIYGRRTGDSLRNIQIGVGVDAPDTASFDGVSNYYFNGNIGVGTTSPTQKLDVNGNVNISGGNDLYVSDDVIIDGEITPTITATQSIGSSALRWLKGWFSSLDVSGNATIGGDLNVSGKITQSIFPHMYGVVTSPQLVAVGGTWYNMTFNSSESIAEGDISFVNNRTLIINEAGDYLIDVGASITDSSASPNAEVAIRMTLNGVQLPHSYFETTTDKQNKNQRITKLVYAELDVGDKLNFQYISSDTTVSINSLNTYNTGVGQIAYGWIQRID